MTVVRIYYNRISELILKHKLLQLLCYMCIGGITGIIGISILYVLTEFFHLLYFISAFIANVIAVLVHFNLNKRITFQNKSKNTITQFSFFVIVAIFSVGISTILLFFIVEFFKVWYIFGQILVILIMFMINFIIHKRITFGMIK